MEAVQAKPRVSYSAFVAQQQGITVASILHRFISEMDGTPERPGIKPLGESHRFILYRVARERLGPKLAAQLTKPDIIDYCRWRKEQGVKPQTVMQDVTYLTGALKYAGSAWDGCEDISDAAIAAAKPFLSKHNLIAKAPPRDRRPQPEETERLLAYFAEQSSHHCTKVDMVKVARWQLASSRRIGETCALLWGDWNREHHTILVRKMKDPRNKNKQKVVALPEEAQAMLIEMEKDRLTPDDPMERIFPYKSKTCSARYTMAKKALGITGLRLHDSRRDCGTRLVEDKGFSPSEAILFTGHETVAIFERTYLKQKPELMKDGPRAKRLGAP